MNKLFNDNFTKESAIAPIKEINDILFDYIFANGGLKLTPSQSAVIDGLITKIGEICDEHAPEQKPRAA